MKIFQLFYVLFMIIVLNASSKIPRNSKHEFEKIIDQTSFEFSIGFEIFNKTGVLPIPLAEFSKYINPSPDIARLEIEKLENRDQRILCLACRTASKIAISFVANTPEAASNSFKKIAVEICVFFKIQPRKVCQGIIDLNWPVLYYILRHHQTELDSESLCGVLMQGSDCGNTNPKFDWSLRIDSNHPKIESHKQIPMHSSSQRLKILHLTDIHYDPSYLVGGKADCNEPVCCRSPNKSSFRHSYNKIGAGKWTDYRNCDIPWELYEDTLNHIQKQHKDFDLIYFTGDIIDHGVWETSESGNIKSIQDVYRHMKKIFGNIPVFPLLGNHESQPLNLFAPDDITDPKLSTQWLYNLVADEWKDWLPESNAQSTIRKGGYYTVTPRKGFRIIALNNNDAYTFNFWLLYKPTHLSKQLQWMHDVLLEAEKANELVHILMHIPSGEGSCFNTWAREFRRIIDRFYHIIGGIFTGHTHFDEFNLYYSLANSSYAIGTAWNGGSLTPFFNVNPNYRTYEIETKSYQVTKHETWIFNLTEANGNVNKSPLWFKEYSFSDAYELNDLSPGSLHQLTEKFTKDKKLLQKYWRYKMKNGDPALKIGCDNECLNKHYCEIVTTQSNDKSKCKSF